MLVGKSILCLCVISVNELCFFAVCVANEHVRFFVFV